MGERGRSIAPIASTVWLAIVALGDDVCMPLGFRPEFIE